MLTDGGEPTTDPDDPTNPDDPTDPTNPTDPADPGERYGPLLDALPDAVFLVDPTTGTVIEANDAASALLGRPVETIAGSPLRDVFPPGPRYDGIGDRLAERRADGGDEPLRRLGDGAPLAVGRRDGTAVPVEIAVERLDDADGETVAVVVRDVADRYTREQRLSVFTRILRHNLRNDLNVVQLYAEELAERAGGSDADVADPLSAKLDGLLALAGKVRTVEEVVGRRDGPVRSVDPTAIVRRIASDVEAAFPGSTVEVDGAAGTNLSTRPAAFEEAVRNVVENAVEHAGVPEPRARVSVDRMADGFEVVVDDQGPGLPDHERAVLLRGEETPLEHGSGIGLWLVNWATAAAEGDVFFESTAEGSRVILWFPDLGA